MFRRSEYVMNIVFHLRSFLLLTIGLYYALGEIFSYRLCFYPSCRVYATVNVPVCLSVCNVCIVDKRCVLEQKLLLKFYRSRILKMDWYQIEWF